MLPTKVKQVDFFEIEDIINNICNNKIFKSSFFECVATESTSGTFVASLLSKILSIPMILINNQNIDSIKTYNKILLVDLIAFDNKLNNLKSELFNKFPEKKFFTLALLSDNSNLDFDYLGIKGDYYYLTPWNKGSYTPETHLNRLLDNSKTTFDKNSFFIGISSTSCLETLQLYHNKKFKTKDYSIFDNDIHKKISSSQITTNEKNDSTLTIEEYFIKNKPYFSQKIDFINKNGITEFYDESIKDCIILSENCPIINVFFVEKTGVHLIRSKIKQSQ